MGVCEGVSVASHHRTGTSDRFGSSSVRPSREVSVAQNSASTVYVVLTYRTISAPDGY